MASLLEPGRVCIKLAGRDAGSRCVITKVIDDNYVMIKSGKRIKGTKERKCNVKHLEILPQKIDLGKSDDLKKIFGG